ncbi:arachidonate 12-lipoxygenase, 12S-type isoform X3 [Mustelus asterias]
MVTYSVTVATGTTSYSGTNNYIYITLIGEKGESEKTKLDKWLQNDLERGSVDEYEVKSPRDLGSIRWLRLEKVRFLVEDDWFCRYAMVRTPSGETLHFPCYRWLSEDDVIHMREGPAKRPTDDKSPAFLTHRMKELDERQKLYRWKLWKPGVTKCIDAESEDNLHPDVKFDEYRRSDFEHALHVALGELFLKKFVNLFGSSWDSLKSFQRIFWRVKNNIGNYVMKHWKEDWFFGYQFKNGCNPCIIEKCSKIPENFPVTNDMVCKSLGGSTLEEQIQLLTPHTRYTLEINTRARNDLLGKNGVIIRVVASGGRGMDVIAQKAFEMFSYSALCLPDNLKQRGLEGLKDYYYQEDGLQLWFAINKYVKGIAGLYYKTDQEVCEDSELQAWIQDLLQEGFQELPGFGMPEAFHTREELYKFLTMVIFTCSAQHAALNNGQYDWCCWIPNSPCTMRQPPLTSKDDISVEQLMETLPDMSQSSVQMAFTWHLGRKLPNKILLGCFDEEYFTEEGAKKVIAEFREELKDIEKRIEKRNEGLPLGYEYLKPSNIENSVSI